MTINIAGQNCSDPLGMYCRYYLPYANLFKINQSYKSRDFYDLGVTTEVILFVLMIISDDIVHNTKAI
jgi:hypothetical protein